MLPGKLQGAGPGPGVVSEAPKSQRREERKRVAVMFAWIRKQAANTEALRSGPSTVHLQPTAKFPRGRDLQMHSSTTLQQPESYTSASSGDTSMKQKVAPAHDLVCEIERVVAPRWGQSP